MNLGDTSVFLKRRSGLQTILGIWDLFFGLSFYPVWPHLRQRTFLNHRSAGRTAKDPQDGQTRSKYRFVDLQPKLFRSKTRKTSLHICRRTILPETYR